MCIFNSFLLYWYYRLTNQMFFFYFAKNNMFYMFILLKPKYVPDKCRLDVVWWACDLFNPAFTATEESHHILPLFSCESLASDSVKLWPKFY